MSRESLYEVIRRPVLTEKSNRAEAGNIYCFEVASWATKTQVREAVSTLFGVKVIGVNVLNRLGKTKRRGKVTGKRSDRRLAYVRVAEGQAIVLTETNQTGE